MSAAFGLLVGLRETMASELHDSTVVSFDLIAHPLIRMGPHLGHPINLRGEQELPPSYDDL